MAKPKPLSDKALNKANKLSLESDNNSDILLFNVVKPRDILLRSSWIKTEESKMCHTSLKRVLLPLKK